VGYFTYKLFNDGIYSYDPSFHGPFMYYVTAEVYRRMGDSIYSSRLLPALFGAAMIFLLIPLRKYIGNTGVILSAFFLALSSSFLYYSRFYREDIFIAFFSLLMFVCAVKYAEKYFEEKYSFFRIFYLFLAAISLASMAALKENAYIAMALIVFFLFLLFIREKGYQGLIAKIKSFDKKLPTIVLESIFFIFVFLIAFSLYYTGKPLELHGMYAAFERAVIHWYEMHRIERIGGPYFFYLPILALYELPILVFGVIGMAYYGYYDKAKEKMLTVFLAYWVIADIMYYISNVYPQSARFFPTAYIPSSIVILFPLLIYGIICVLKSSNIFLAFLTYWALANLFVYSYIQEKVPWLVLNFLLPLVIIAAVYLGEHLPRLDLKSKAGAATIIFLVLSSSYFAYSSIFLNFYDYTNPAEPLIQAAQPPQKFSLFIDKISEISRQYKNQSTEIQITDNEMETQFLWYLRHYGNVRWRVNIDSELAAPLIVVHDSDDKHEPDIVKSRMRSDYERLDSAKMSWYFFAPSDITLNYLLYRKMDKPPGEYRVVLFYQPRY
ncbi:MAG: TIGR03663 family protein, partial [Candidatus Methanoperedens sp.]|nr:TIGR03663 family protein [Candidatus Methanoperedens sp.]